MGAWAPSTPPAPNPWGGWSPRVALAQFAPQTHHGFGSRLVKLHHRGQCSLAKGGLRDVGT